MTRRALILAALAFAVLALGLVPASGPGVTAAQAQIADPPDDTLAGGLDETDIGAPVDEVDATPTPGGGVAPSGPPPPDPDAGLDDTTAGGLDQTDLGGALDETDHPAVDNPAPPVQTPAGPGGTVTQVIYVPVPTSTAPNKASGKRTSTHKKRKAAKKRKLARKRKQARKRRHAHRRRLAHRRMFVAVHTRH
jgi:hypothetical protein